MNLYYGLFKDFCHGEEFHVETNQSNRTLLDKIFEEPVVRRCLSHSFPANLLRNGFHRLSA